MSRCTNKELDLQLSLRRRPKNG